MLQTQLMHFVHEAHTKFKFAHVRHRPFLSPKLTLTLAVGFIVFLGGWVGAEAAFALVGALGVRDCAPDFLG